MSSPDVVVLGDVNVDVLAQVDHYPALGGHAFAEDVHVESGGSAANTAVVLGRLGLDVVMLGCVGDDSLAEHALRGLRSAAVDVSRVCRHPDAATGLFFVAVTPDGERTMFGGRGANCRLSPDDIDAAAVGASLWLHLSGYPLLSNSGQASLWQAIDIARGAGIPISLDVGIGPSTGEWRGAVLELAAAVDLVLANALEAGILAGDMDSATAARRLRAGEDQTVVLKLGAGGCHLLAGAEEWALPAFDVAPVDSTGAGDAFNAGVIAGRLAGWGWRASVLLANALGGLATTVLGAGGVLPGPDRVVGFLEERRHDPPWAEWAGEFDVICEWLEGKL